MVKPLAEPAVAEAGELTMAYCRRMEPADYYDLAGVELTAHQFQQWIEPHYAVRLTAIAERLFAVAIHPQSDAARVDWRAHYDSHRYEVIDYPPAVAGSVCRYLHAFNITFGAFDFIADHAGDWHFLECNPAGSGDGSPKSATYLSPKQSRPT